MMTVKYCITEGNKKLVLSILIVTNALPICTRLHSREESFSRFTYHCSLPASVRVLATAAAYKFIPLRPAARGDVRFDCQSAFAIDLRAVRVALISDNQRNQIFC